MRRISISFKQKIDSIREIELTESKIASLIRILQDKKNEFDEDIYNEIAGALDRVSTYIRKKYMTQAFKEISYIQELLHDVK